MRVSYVNLANGTRESIYLSLEQLENKKRVEEIENEIEHLFRQFNSEDPRESKDPKEPAAILERLNNVQSFTKDALNHIFKGEINAEGKLKGYHHEGIRGDTARIIPHSRSAPDKNGVYRGGVEKEHHGQRLVKDGGSTFFPKEWTPQKVVNEINHARLNAVPTNPNRPTVLEGVSSTGMTIRIVVHKKTGKIKNAYPVKED